MHTHTYRHANNFRSFTQAGASNLHIQSMYTNRQEDGQTDGADRQETDSQPGLQRERSRVNGHEPHRARRRILEPLVWTHTQDSRENFGASSMDTDHTHIHRARRRILEPLVSRRFSKTPSNHISLIFAQCWIQRRYPTATTPVGLRGARTEWILSETPESRARLSTPASPPTAEQYNTVPELATAATTISRLRHLCVSMDRVEYFCLH